MDRGAWWTVLHAVAKGWTQLSAQTFEVATPELPGLFLTPPQVSFLEGLGGGENCVWKQEELTGHSTTLRMASASFIPHSGQGLCFVCPPLYHQSQNQILAQSNPSGRTE